MWLINHQPLCSDICIQVPIFAGEVHEPNLRKEMPPDAKRRPSQSIVTLALILLIGGCVSRSFSRSAVDCREDVACAAN